MPPKPEVASKIFGESIDESYEYSRPTIARMSVIHPNESVNFLDSEEHKKLFSSIVGGGAEIGPGKILLSSQNFKKDDFKNM